MNGEDLVYDWQFNVVDEPTEWGFNWDYAEGGTPHPKPRENHATMWFVVNESNPVHALKIFFTKASSNRPIKFKKQDPRDDDDTYKFTVTHQRTKQVLMTGEMNTPDASAPDANVGNYAVFQAETQAGFSLMRSLSQVAPGFIAVLPHERVEVPLKGGYKVVSTTGLGPEDDEANREDIATRFTLYDNEEVVARCTLTYRDETWDPSMGPTIEMIAVKQSRRGEGLAKVLFYWVRSFIEENFTVECLNNDVPPKHCMIKATQLSATEVDVRVDKEDGTRHPMGFKEFLYDYCEFSVREQKGAAAFLMGSNRPKDEEAVLYIPLLTKEELEARKSGRGGRKKKPPRPGKAHLREKCGARMCHWCTNVSVELRRCNRCGIAFYCNPMCQKNDWKRHKKWCSKTREQVRERLIKEGSMMKTSDGSWSLIMNGPGRTMPGGMNL